jgi:O-antigen/teichoic acid export membrane protein
VLGTRTPPTVLGRLLSGTAWLTLQFPLQILFSFWSLRLIVESIGPDGAGAYRFAFGFGLLQLLLEFGTGSALQLSISDAWARGDRAGVDRAIAAGMSFYAATAFVQAAVLLSVAYLAVPHAGFDGASLRLVIRLLWLQAVTSPGFGVAVVVSSVLQAARRYDLVPRYELAITTLRFFVLMVGVKAGIDFFWVVVGQTLVVTTLRIGPGLRVMSRELGYRLHFAGARWADFKELGRFGFYMALIQIGTVLTDKVDTSILGFVLASPGPHIAAYDVVSKPFLLLRQVGGMLASMVVPAVAGLAAVRDERGLERILYDGTRLYIGVLLPVGILAWIHAGSFLSLWFGHRLGYDATDLAPLVRLFLVATIPMTLAVPVQVAIGLGRIRLIALAALAGLLINLPVSCFLAARLGVAGVIWGSVLTTLVFGLAVPGPHIARVLGIDPWAFLGRCLTAPLSGAAALIGADGISRYVMSPTGVGISSSLRVESLILNLGVGSLFYLGGYMLTPAGRGDLARLLARFRHKAVGLQ